MPSDRFNWLDKERIVVGHAVLKHEKLHATADGLAAIADNSEAAKCFKHAHALFGKIMTVTDTAKIILFFQTKLDQQGEPFATSPDQTVLMSALASGHEMPSSCRNGVCRTCIKRLQSGRVTYRMEWPGLSAEEKAEGWFLPCVAYPASDLLISSFD